MKFTDIYRVVSTCELDKSCCRNIKIYIKSHPVLKVFHFVVTLFVQFPIPYFIFPISHFCQRNQMTFSAELFISVMPDKH